MAFQQPMEDDLRYLVISSKNIISRMEKVMNFKERQEIERRSLMKALDKAYAERNVEKLRDISAKLQPVLTEGVIRSVAVLRDVLAHHVPRMSDYVSRLPQDEFSRKTQELIATYADVERRVVSEAIPALEQQVRLLEEFRAHLGLPAFIAFNQAFEQEIKAYDRIMHDSGAKLDKMLRMRKELVKGAKALSKFKAQNPKTVLAFELMLALVPAYAAISKTAKAAKLFSLFGKSIDKISTSYSLLSAADNNIQFFFGEHLV